MAALDSCCSAEAEQLCLCRGFGDDDGRVNADSRPIGVCWGRSGNNLPSASKVVGLLQQVGITRVRLFDSDDNSLKALAKTNIDVIVAVTNEELEALAVSEDSAAKWVKDKVQDYVSSGVSIKMVAVGTEVLTITNLSQYLLPAMSNIHTALTKAGLADSIKVSTPHSMSVLQKSFPPSAGRFNTSFAPVVRDILQFLQQTGSIFMINAYPYYAYTVDDDVRLSYALFESDPGITDPGTGLKYSNIYEAQLDAVFAAMSSFNYSQLSLMVSEAGWPSKGDSGEKGAGLKNAETFNNNLVQHTVNNKGTPGKPGMEIDAYIFALYNENAKPGPTSERNWGLFNPDNTPVYNVNFGSSGNSNSGGGNNGGGSGGGNSNTGGGGSSTSRAWCVARTNVANATLQAALDYACGPGRADCGPIQRGGSCYQPNTVVYHASYAFNSFWVRSGFQAQACNFSGAATLSANNPSKFHLRLHLLSIESTWLNRSSDMTWSLPGLTQAYSLCCR